MTLRNELHARAMRYFMAVYEHEGYGEAADELCITQPALSNSISKLESQIGVKLFDRGPGGTRPTPYAKVLYRRAKLVCAELDLAFEELKELEDAQMGSVSVGFGPSVQELFSKILIDVLSGRPKLSVAVIQAHAESLINGLRRGELDIVICTAPQEIVDEELSVELLAELPTVPIVRVDHPLCKKRYKASSMTEYPWIIADIKLEPRSKNIFEFFSGKRPETIITSNSPTFTKLMVSRSDFICFMPITHVGREDFEGKLVALGGKEGLYKTPLVIITRRNSFLPSAGQIIREEFKKTF